MQLQHKRDCASQILKAAMAINSNALAEMDVPESYLDSLPKVCGDVASVSNVQLCLLVSACCNNFEF
jgi:hypothetical protein